MWEFSHSLLYQYYCLGNGGWTSRGVGEGPVFKYQFVLSDGSDRLVIPHEIDIEKINAATTVSKVIDLGKEYGSIVTVKFI